MTESFPTNGIGAKAWFKDRMEPKQYIHDYLNENSVVLDLGAYTGTYTDNIFKRYRCNVYAFEPVKQFFNKLKSKYRKNDKVRTLNYGLGECDKDLTLYISGIATSTKNSGGRRTECKIMDIDDFLVTNNLSGPNSIDLMAINIEGGEYALLEYMIEKKLIDCVKAFQIQFHNFDYINNYKSRRLNIQRELDKTHKLVYNYEFCWEKWEKR
jgi:FkbM family methyltransferase